MVVKFQNEIWQRSCILWSQRTKGIIVTLIWVALVLISSEKYTLPLDSWANSCLPFPVKFLEHLIMHLKESL